MKYIILAIFLLLGLGTCYYNISNSKKTIPIVEKSKVKYVCLDGIVYVNIYDTAYTVKYESDRSVQKCD